MELPDFRIGKSGIEKSQDIELRGTAGASQVEVNALGRVVREVAVSGPDRHGRRRSPRHGAAGFRTRRCTAEESATLVLLDAVTGEVLAMASSPALTMPSTGCGALDGADTDPHVPLYNKAIQGVYPPGSTFKPWRRRPR